MRIAMICVNRCPLRPLGGKDTGGMHLYVRQLSQELGRLGVEVDIFTRWHDASESEVMEIGKKARLIHIAAGEREDILKTDIYHCLPQFSSNLRHFLDREGVAYDLLHSHYWLSALAGEQLQAQLGIPHVATFHTLGEVKNRARPAEMEPILRIETERKAVASADCIIAVSAEEKDDLINIYGARLGRVKVIPCGVDLGLFHPTDKEKLRSELGLSGHSKIILYAGRIEPFKGIDILLRAVACLEDKKDLRLLIVGGDSDSDGEVARLRSLASELGIEERVIFWGTVEHDRMPLFYNAANVCVVTSYHESFGLVAVEALACSTPVVAPRVGGLATIIKDGETGYLIDDRSGEAFAQRLELLLSDEVVRQRMEDAARPSVMKYAWPIVARQVLSTYEELSTARVPLIP
jgi:D-inositol-3-phosphate glycosyltransferase